jgi:nitroreductase
VNSFQETPEMAWQERFGEEAPRAAARLANQLVHRSIRSFSDRTVDEDMVTALVGAAQSASTSSNLQMWSVVSVQDLERRERIAKLCAGQDQVHRAPWFFAFLADHHRLRYAAEKEGEPALGLSFTEYLVMAVIDASLAAERFVCAAESVGLGVCYIGALRNHPQEVKELLQLPKGVFGLFGLCLGFPASPLEAPIRPRLATKTVWFKETYEPEPEPDISNFEARMAEFYSAQQMRGDYSWSKRSGRRVDRSHLSGRDVLKSWLADQGMGTE